MTNSEIYLLIFGMFIVTYIPRLLPILVFSKYKMSKELNRFITYFPVAILTSLVIKELLFIDESLVLNFSNIKLIPAAITLFVSVKFKSIGLSIVVGVLAYSLLRVLY